MKLFSCGHCGQTLYFENTVCERCGHALGYDPVGADMLALEPDGDAFAAVGAPGRLLRYCLNARHGACNWLVDANGGDGFCLACRHNDTVPDLSDPTSLAHFQTIERAKKRLFYAILRLGLPHPTRDEDPEKGLSFLFLDETVGGEEVTTGHAGGVITLALGEADDAERERRRADLGEPYRTLLGHFRHEIAHYYWDLLVAPDPTELDRCRAVFGDETADYAAAMQRHYETGAPADWQADHVSAYSTMHPWEDFAETWAHYLHIVDTTEMASAFGVAFDPGGAGYFDAYSAPDIDAVMARWVPLAALMNNLNRAVGQSDAYPFVLTPPVIGKLDYVRGLLARSRRAAG